MLGITNPSTFDLDNYLGYDLSRKTGLGKHFRILEVVLNRNGRSNGLCPLYFDGAVNYFSAMPAPNDDENLRKVYEHIASLSPNRDFKRNYSFVTFLKNKLSHDPITNYKKFCAKL